MATHVAAQAELCRLRQDIARLEGRLAETDRMVLDSPPEPRPAKAGAAPGLKRAERAPLPALRSDRTEAAGLKPRQRRGRLRFGIPALDDTTGGGLPLATLHEIRAGESRDGGAAAGFVLALLARLCAAGEMPAALWINEVGTRREAGKLYGPGLAALGLDPGRIVEVAAGSQAEALWAFEAALACRGVGAAVCELRRASLDLTATRRCALRARDAGVTGFLLRISGEAEPSAAELRFRVAPAPAGTIGSFAAGIGRTAWRLILEKSRGGRTGSFRVEWNAYERRFDGRCEAAERPEAIGDTHPQPGAAPAPDGPSSARPSSRVEESRGGGSRLPARRGAS